MSAAWTPSLWTPSRRRPSIWTPRRRPPTVPWWRAPLLTMSHLVRGSAGHLMRTSSGHLSLGCSAIEDGKCFYRWEVSHTCAHAGSPASWSEVTYAGVVCAEAILGGGAGQLDHWFVESVDKGPPQICHYVYYTQQGECERTGDCGEPPEAPERPDEPFSCCFNCISCLAHSACFSTGALADVESISYSRNYATGNTCTGALGAGQPDPAGAEVRGYDLTYNASLSGGATTYYTGPGEWRWVDHLGSPTSDWQPGEIFLDIHCGDSGIHWQPRFATGGGPSAILFAVVGGNACGVDMTVAQCAASQNQLRYREVKAQLKNNFCCHHGGGSPCEPGTMSSCASAECAGGNPFP